MIEHLSVSSINMFLRCPMQWEFRYLREIKIPPAGAIIQGKAYHETIATDLQNKQSKGKLLPDDIIGDIFSASFDEQVHRKVSDDEGEIYEFEDIDWAGKSPGELKDEGISLSQLYHKTIAPQILPIDVEKRDEAIISDVKFVLIVDVLTDNIIIDHKVKARRFSEDDLKRDIQATAYTWYYKKPLEFHQALKQKNPVIEIAKAIRTSQDWEFFVGLVPKVWGAIQTGIFYPSPNGWHCSENFCGYWKLCRGK